MLRRYGKEYVAEMLAHPPEPLNNYINMPVIRKTYNTFLQDKNAADLEWVWQTVIFAAWMKQAGCVV